MAYAASPMVAIFLHSVIPPAWHMSGCITEINPRVRASKNIHFPIHRSPAAIVAVVPSTIWANASTRSTGIGSSMKRGLWGANDSIICRPIAGFGLWISIAISISSPAPSRAAPKRSATALTCEVTSSPSPKATCIFKALNPHSSVSMRADSLYVPGSICVMLSNLVFFRISGVPDS